ncbi:MAG: aminotransferase class V-fold PLP-dependent enzyme [Planctomycetota bacterium]|nr:aminotransferase class V-fold PLP-dependent enzyme [Planctomycetota bacterium]
MQSSLKCSDKLAMHGGRQAVEGLPAWPLPDEQVRLALEAAYADGTWGRYHGPHTAALIDRLAYIHHDSHVLLCCSGTYAIEAALRGLAVGQGDEVMLAGYDFPGNFRAIEAVGARPVLVDIQPDSWSLHPDQLASAMSERTQAVIVSHLHGTLAPMAELMAWAGTAGIAVVEDACQTPGASINGQLAGTFGDVGVLSFGGSKLLTAGRGGAMLTCREDVYQRAKIYGQRGNDAFPLSELQAAVLLPQLEKLEQHNQQRRRTAERLSGHMHEISFIKLPREQTANAEPSYYKLGLFLNESLPSGVTRDELVAALRAEGVPLDSGFAGFARRSPRRCRHSGLLENSRYAATFTVLLHHPILLGGDHLIDQLVVALRKVETALHQNRLSARDVADA